MNPREVNLIIVATSKGSKAHTLYYYFMLTTYQSYALAIKDMGVVKHIIGMRINITKEGLDLSHAEYVKKLLKRFNIWMMQNRQVLL